MKELSKIYEILYQYKITTNQYYVLSTLKDDVTYPDFVNVKLELYRMELNDIVKQGIFRHEPTIKGQQILDKIKKIFQSKTKLNNFEDWEDDIIKYNNCFPKMKKK